MGTRAARKVKLIEAKQLNPGQMLGIIVQCKNILLAKIDGVLYAIDSKCCYQDILLYNGVIKPL